MPIFSDKAIAVLSLEARGGPGWPLRPYCCSKGDWGEGRSLGPMEEWKLARVAEPWKGLPPGRKT